MADRPSALTGRWRVVVIDDDDGMRSLIRSVLDRTDDFVIVAEACDGSDGLQRVEATKPDIILLDVLMPGVSGLEVLPRLREVAPASKIVLLTVLEPWALDPEPAHEADLVLSKLAITSTLVDDLRSAVLAGPQRQRRIYDRPEDSP